jgi:hypothetical protein
VDVDGHRTGRRDSHACRYLRNRGGQSVLAPAQLHDEPAVELAFGRGQGLLDLLERGDSGEGARGRVVRRLRRRHLPGQADTEDADGGDDDRPAYPVSRECVHRHLSTGRGDAHERIPRNAGEARL